MAACGGESDGFHDVAYSKRPEVIQALIDRAESEFGSTATGIRNVWVGCPTGKSLGEVDLGGGLKAPIPEYDGGHACQGAQAWRTEGAALIKLDRGIVVRCSGGLGSPDGVWGDTLGCERQ